MAYSLLITYDQRVTKVEKNLQRYKTQLLHPNFFPDEYINKIYRSWVNMRKSREGGDFDVIKSTPY